MGDWRRHQHHVISAESPSIHAVIERFGEGVVTMSYGFGVTRGTGGVQNHFGIVRIHRYNRSRPFGRALHEGFVAQDLIRQVFFSAATNDMLEVRQ